MKFEELDRRSGTCATSGCRKPPEFRVRIEISKPGQSKSTIGSFCEDHAVQVYRSASKVIADHRA